MRHRSRSRSPAGRRFNALAGGIVPAVVPPAGSVLWLDPTTGLFQETTGASATTPAVADGDPVGTWASRSGSIYFTAASNTVRPLLKFASGKPYLLFDGVDDLLSAGDLSATFPSAATLGIRVNHEGTASARMEMATTPSGGADCYSRFDGANSYPGVFHNRIDTQPIIPQGWATVVSRSDASAFSRRLNGTQDITAAAAFQKSGSVSIGGAAGKFFQGRIAGMVCYATALSDADAGKLETYLGNL